MKSFSSDILEPAPQSVSTPITKAPFNHDNHVQVSGQDMLLTLYAQPLPRRVMTHLFFFGRRDSLLPLEDTAFFATSG
ncbi:MAG: hypothetical protein C0514_01085 [Candidatus Puniceispirillum sp.]|nr:hypothetical protein [Candidatus Puniceispirillum sp.]